MESNLLLEQYSWYKKQQLAKAPFECLLNADIEPNPHQVNAFCAAIQALKTGGIILADEVGLGKTIEAGLVLNYVLDNGAKKVLISLPAKIVRHILEMARAIKTNAKIIALREALKSAFAHQISEGLNQKAVVFTESKRTQKYIAAELRKSGYSEEDILLFNGDFDDAMTKEIFRTWQVKNFGKTNYGRSVEYKHAIVDYFKSHAKILIVTDAGSEGLNLQFCNTIINYDLPWNPQKIEQRIGRCHRYGQTHDVVAINLLNTDSTVEYKVINDTVLYMKEMNK